jgi:hypothetical protein
LSFPTSDMVAGFSTYLYFRSLEDELRERAPELAERIERPEVSPLFIKVHLKAGTCLILAQTSLGGTAVWALVDPDFRSARRIWPLTTPIEVLAEALAVRANAWIRGSAEPSPWRWDEPKASAATELADLLTAQGFEVDAVLAENRCFVEPAINADGRAVGRLEQREGAMVRAQRDGIAVRAAQKSALGWVVDMSEVDTSDWRRLDTGYLRTGVPTAAPGLGPDTITVQELGKLVAAGAEALSAAQGEGVTASPVLAEPLPFLLDRAEQHSHTQVLNAVAQLRAMGFSDIEAFNEQENPLRSATFHIVWSDGQRDLGLPELQRLIGLAAVEGKRLLVVIGGHVTRPAAAFADRAKSFLFRLDGRSGVLSGVNSYGEEALSADWYAWIRRQLRDWS